MPKIFTSSSGKAILVGRDKNDNSRLTSRARSYCLFFHASDFSGSHVILKLREDQSATRDDILDAACLAAYYSKGRDRKVVLVDYTKRNNVKQIKGFPGLVELLSFKTIKVKASDIKNRNFIS